MPLLTFMRAGSCLEASLAWLDPILQPRCAFCLPLPCTCTCTPARLAPTRPCLQKAVGLPVNFHIGVPAEKIEELMHGSLVQVRSASAAVLPRNVSVAQPLLLIAGCGLSVALPVRCLLSGSRLQVHASSCPCCVGMLPMCSP